MHLRGYIYLRANQIFEDSMLGLYAIAFFAPLLVFGSFGYFIMNLHSQDKVIFANRQRTLTIFVYIPLGVSYGLIAIIATWQFIQYIQGF